MCHALKASPDNSFLLAADLLADLAALAASAALAAFLAAFTAFLANLTARSAVLLALLTNFSNLADAALTDALLFFEDFTFFSSAVIPAS